MAVNRKVGGSKPPGGEYFSFFFAGILVAIMRVSVFWWVGDKATFFSIFEKKSSLEKMDLGETKEGDFFF